MTQQLDIPKVTPIGKPVWQSRIVGHDRVDPASLVANPNNFRTHPQAQREALSQAIEQLGFLRSVTVNMRTGNLVDGHERVWQALLTEQPLIDVEYVDLSEAEEKAALATMDPISEMASVDAAKLDELLRDVSVNGEALQQMLADLADDAGLYQSPEVTEDEVPEPPVDPVTKPGDLWLLGEHHRLLCGDSTKAEDVERLLDGREPFIMVTDPPYGVEYDADWRNDALRADGSPSDGRAIGKVQNDDRVDWTESYKLFPGHVAYVWHAGRHASDVVLNLAAAAFEMRCQLIWSKSNFAIGRGHYHWGHEPCWYAVRKGGSAKWCGDRTQSTVWNIAKPSKSETGHSTQKPVECMARPIRNHGGKDDDVYDPFLGSGTTLIAAEQLGRRCYAIEISPAYCDVAVQRWEKLTGKKAELSK